MKYPCSLLLLFAAFPLLFADYVELKDGRRIEGTILSENKASLEIEVGANEARTIRQVLIIDFVEVTGWSADAMGRTLEKSDVAKLQGNDYLAALIVQAETAIGEKNYDEAIQRFRDVAELAAKANEGLETPTPDSVKALELRAQAFELLCTTLEGKVEVIDKYVRQNRNRMEEEMKVLQDEWEEIENAKEEAERAVKRGGRRVELGVHRTAERVSQEEEQDARRRIAETKARHLVEEENLVQLEREQALAAAEAKVMKERASHARDEAKDAARLLRGRRR